jgi:hypothetical protein
VVSCDRADSKPSICQLYGWLQDLQQWQQGWGGLYTWLHYA